MPEGDTIHRLARRLRPLLVGKALVRLAAPRSSRTTPPAGTLVADVVAEGKHLLVRFADGHELRSHMGMWGQWRVQPPGTPMRAPEHLVRAVLEVEGLLAFCVQPREVELLRRAPSAPTTVTRLGPDLCRDDADLDETVRRIDALPPDTLVVDALLDQRVFTGVGNVFKSEVLWAVGVSPFERVGYVDAARRRALVDHAARLLRKNLLTRRRTTVSGPPGSLAVYGRGGEACRRCGDVVERVRLGREGRSTYYCPSCQRPAQALPR